jgi:hypothetical protein
MFVSARSFPREEEGAGIEGKERKRKKGKGISYRGIKRHSLFGLFALMSSVRGLHVPVNVQRNLRSHEARDAKRVLDITNMSCPHLVERLDLLKYLEGAPGISEELEWVRDELTRRFINMGGEHRADCEGCSGRKSDAENEKSEAAITERTSEKGGSKPSGNSANQIFQG